MLVADIDYAKLPIYNCYLIIAPSGVLSMVESISILDRNLASYPER